MMIKNINMKWGSISIEYVENKHFPYKWNKLDIFISFRQKKPKLLFVLMYSINPKDIRMKVVYAHALYEWKISLFGFKTSGIGKNENFETNNFFSVWLKKYLRSRHFRTWKIFKKKIELKEKHILIWSNPTLYKIIFWLYVFLSIKFHVTFWLCVYTI